MFDHLLFQMEGCFSQPNGMVCASMLSWAQNVTKTDDSTPTTDLLELYCGNCNFTIPLAQNFNRIIATELSRVAVGSARENIDNNKIKNIILVSMKLKPKVLQFCLYLGKNVK